MFPVLLFFGALIAAIAVASSTAKASTAKGGGAEPCTTADEAFVKSVVFTLRDGGVLDPGLVAKAHAIALRCFPGTAIELAKAMNRGLPGLAPIPADKIPVPIVPVVPSPAQLLLDSQGQGGASSFTDVSRPAFIEPLLQPITPGTAKPKPIVPQADLLGRATAALATPDNPPAPIPLKGGKTLWFIETKKGKPMAIPRFPEVLAEFKSFQKIIGVSQDGRIGTDTLKTFIALAAKRGFTSVPKTVPSLAANVTKWGLVLASPLRRTSTKVSGSASYGW